MDKDKIWKDFLEHIKERTTGVTFNTWFKDLSLLTITTSEIVVIVPHEATKRQLVNNYMDIIEEVFLEITGKDYNVLLCLDGEFKIPEEKSVVNNNRFINTPPISEEDNYRYEKNEVFKTNLKDKYTFDNFVVGDSNRMAFSSCLAVAENPGRLYNPLFLYGKSGLGKTHLMQAIGNYIVTHSDLRVLYISTDDFMNDFLKITKDSGDKEENLNYIDLFKSKYRDVDVLIIDDIQFLSNAKVTQQEFTNTFNDLYYDDKQIIISSDRSVEDLRMFEDRLKTRFNWGLKAIINVPEYDLKVKIIKNKIRNGDFIMELNDDIINCIASNCGNDVRNLEGAIIRLYAYQATYGLKQLTLENTLQAIEEYTTNMLYTDNSISKIISVVANYFKLTVDDIKGKRRSKNIAHARMVAMYLCRIMTEESYPRIALEFGGRDHTTIIHGFETIKKDIQTNRELEKIIAELKVKMSE